MLKMETASEKIIEPVKLFFTCSSPEEESCLPPIIFIHGFFSTNRTFNAVKYKISRKTKRKIYAVDMRNHGKSGWSKNFTLDYLVADFENFMATENIPKAVLAGHSMGGRIALAMALKHPEMVEKLLVEDVCLVTTAAQNEEFKKTFTFATIISQNVSKLKSDMSEKEAQQKIMPLVTMFWPESIKRFKDAKIDYSLPMYKDQTGKFVWEINMEIMLGIKEYLHLFDIDLSSNPVYTGEFLLLAGEKSDARVQDDIETFYRHLPNTECRLIENGYHTFHIEFPDLYVKLASEFISK